MCIFPPFSMLSRVLQKLQEDQGRTLVIAPLWRTQVWFPKMCQVLISQPVLLPKKESLLKLPHNRTKVHPLSPKLQLMACLLSGRDSDSKTFQHGLAISSWNHGGLGPPNSTECIWTSFASTRNENPVHPTVASVIDFLTHLYDTGNSYSVINTARCALSAAVDLADIPYTVGENIICISAVHITSFYVSFLSRVKMNSINWPAPNIWVFIAQLVEHCSANAEAMGSNPVEALKFFSGLNLQLPKLQLQLRWSNLHFIFLMLKNPVGITALCNPFASAMSVVKR